MSYLYETHMHTSEVSLCGRSTADEMIKSYKEKGFSGVVVTDHFITGNSSCPRDIPWKEKMLYIKKGYDQAAISGQKYDISVFFAWEYAVNGDDLLTYGLDIDFLFEYPQIHFCDIETYCDIVHKAGGYIIHAHPYRIADYIPKAPSPRADLIDAVEVYNSSHHHYENDFDEKALEFALKYNLTQTAGSDAHIANFPMVGIEFNKKAKDINDLINMIKSRSGKLMTVPK